MRARLRRLSDRRDASGAICVLVEPMGLSQSEADAWYESRRPDDGLVVRVKQFDREQDDVGRMQ